MSTRRVDLQKRSLVVSTDYCPRCLTRTERIRTSRPLLKLGRLAGVRVSSRSCFWCGWEGLRVQRTWRPDSRP